MHFLVLNWDGWRYETGKELLMLLCLPAARKKSIRVSLDGLGPGGAGGGLILQCMFLVLSARLASATYHSKL